MGEKCERCGPSATNFYIGTVTNNIHTIAGATRILSLHANTDNNTRSGYRVQADILDSIAKGKRPTARSIRMNEHERVDISIDKFLGTIPHSNSLREILPENHSIFTKFTENRALEQSRPNGLNELNEMEKLAESKRKFSKNTRDWMKHKSPFMDSDFTGKLTPKIWSKNLKSLFDEPCSRKEVICCTCGSVVRVFIDIEGKVEYILEQLQIYRTVCDYLDRYDSAMTNWKRDDKAEKERAKKIRLEKKMQADLEALEAEKRSVEEKLRELKGE